MLIQQAEQAESIGQAAEARAKVNHARELQKKLETPSSIEDMRLEVWRFYNEQQQPTA